MRNSWFEKNASNKYYQCPTKKVSRNDVSMKIHINGFDIFNRVTYA